MRIIFRTKGNHKQGMGDVMGSVALAEMLKNKSEVLFVVDNDIEAVDSISQRGYRVKAVNNLKEELAFLESFKPDAIVVNQLNSQKDFLAELKQRTKVLVTIDDVGPGSSIADIRFNPLYYIPESYCSPEFIPLRKEFQDINKKERKISRDVKKILVTLGGSDTYGFTPKVVHALSCVPSDVEITVITGPAFQHTVQLNRAIREAGRQFSIFKNVDNMADIMFSSEIAVCSGGITLFELACAGTPAVVICGEPFEDETAARMQDSGFGINLGFGDHVGERSIMEAADSLMKNYTKRLEMSRRGKELVDGIGAKRMAEVIMRDMIEGVTK